ncbi:formate dehydrogenase accessory sulfurtransferase FdhD [Gluconacetobacter diazotrophicus]|uniref:Sulfur carrier protein FdhD n=2 Tax=Gluconacetobacter diazotrophicus TaxID=33996 RepID=A9HDE0_GLUDA|nr:formate dehydrogenase accessory sulfurtransferase FdhD [Gluconacetobacter diazotrophicus]MBB2155348.1 formate dehydrogenase accessory sulfurtransferase FdhD [Gluconacetobacter diazotrophicus]CAP55088.1 putative formate dehydrogenase accessory protein [Gluconacetobacter diazotrophicus PA1 5]
MDAEIAGADIAGPGHQSNRPAAWRECPGQRLGADGAAGIVRPLAEEVPVGLTYNGLAHAVMMATPADLEDFATGFSVTEAIVPSAAAIRDLRVTHASGGITVDMRIPGDAFARLLARRRHLTGRTGCGVCGVEDLAAFDPAPPPVPVGGRVALSAVRAALDGLAARQVLNARVHMVHGAAWAGPDGALRLVREDVGRHNALDKLVGAGLRDGIAFDAGFGLITSRCSYEMVQKAAMAGLTVLVAISAPTARAVDMAHAAGLTLVALARHDAQIIFTHQGRIDTAA